MNLISQFIAEDGFQWNPGYGVSSDYLSRFGEYGRDIYGIYRYWVSAISSIWDSTDNWSMTSGGPGGASVPDTTNIAVCDSSGLGTCTLDTTVNTGGLQLRSGFTGIFNQNNYGIRIGSYGANFSDGVFHGEGANIRVTGDTYIGNNSDFTSTDATLSCDSTLLIQEGFYHNGGVVSLESYGCALDAADQTFFTLQFNTPQGWVESSCIVDHSLVMKSGCTSYVVDQTSVFIHIKKDATCASLYNEQSERNNLNLTFDGTRKQVLYSESGGILPNILIEQVRSIILHGKESVYTICEGDSPIVIRGSFLLNDGTFNMNRHDIQVGLY